MTKTATKTLSGKTQKILNMFQFLYVAAAILISLLFILEVLLGKPRLEVLIPIAVICAIAYGIVKRKPWTIMVITLVAAFGIFNDLLRPESLGVKIFFIAFFLFEIYFFNRKDVRAAFGAKQFVTLF